MPELITNPFGYTPDPIDAVMNKDGVTAYAVGDVLELTSDTSFKGPGLNFAGNQTTGETTSSSYAVVTAAATAAERTVSVCLRGMVQANMNGATATTSAPILVASVSVGVTTETITSASAMLLDKPATALAHYVGSTASPSVGLIDVYFDGVNGLGTVRGV